MDDDAPINEREVRYSSARSGGPRGPVRAKNMSSAARVQRIWNWGQSLDSLIQTRQTYKVALNLVRKLEPKTFSLFIANCLPAFHMNVFFPSFSVLQTTKNIVACRARVCSCMCCTVVVSWCNIYLLIIKLYEIISSYLEKRKKKKIWNWEIYFGTRFFMRYLQKKSNFNKVIILENTYTLSMNTSKVSIGSTMYKVRKGIY